MTDMIKAKAERVASGSTFAEISGKMLGNLEFMFPSKPEQDKIGGYFESLDNLITLQQRELNCGITDDVCVQTTRFARLVGSCSQSLQTSDLHLLIYAPLCGAECTSLNAKK